MFEPRHTTHGFQFARIEGHPGPSHPRRRHRRRRAHRPPAHGLVPLQRRAAQPPPRHHRVVLPRQRLRDPDRLPAARARGLDRRLAALRPDRGLPLRRRRLLAQVAARPGRRTARGRLRSRTSCRIPCATATSRDGIWRTHAGVLGLGRRHRDRPLGDVARLSATRRARRAVADMVALGRLRRRDAPRTQRHPDRAEARPEPAPHEQLPVGQGVSLGRVARAWRGWSDDHSDQGPRLGRHRVPAPLRRAWRRSAGCSATTPRRRRFEELAANALDAGEPSSSAPDGSLTPDTQANHVRALAFGLVPESCARSTAGRLVELIRDAGTHLGTGFLATPFLLPVLADTGHLDVAYELLLQDTPPSWLAHGRAWRHHGLGVLGGHRRRRRPARVAEPLQQGRGRSRSCTATSPASHCSTSTRLPALPGRAPPGRRAHLGRGGARLAVRAHRVVLALGGRDVPAHRRRPARDDRRGQAPRRFTNRPGPRRGTYECALR